MTSKFNKTFKQSLVTLTTASLLLGCSISPDDQTYVKNQQQQMQSFIAETDIGSNLAGQTEINWWQQLESAQLNQLVNDALASNHDLKTSFFQLQSALARLGAEQATYLPQGDLALNANRTSLDSNISRQSSANVNISWQLDLFGRIAALVNAANASALSQAEQLRLLKIEVISSVVNGYISYQGGLQKQYIVKQQIEALEQSIDVLQARVEEGVATELDLNRTKAQLSQQQSLLPGIKYQLYSDLSTLAVLTGRIASDLAINDERNILDMTLPVKLLNPSEAIALRPDISQALYQLSQQSALTIAAQKALWPDISLSGFAGVLSLGSNEFSNTQQQWQLTPQIKWSLLSYPALLAQRDAQQFLSEAAYSDYQQVVLKAVSESELSLQLLVNESEKQGFANNRYQYANKAFLQAEAMYEEGQIPYLDLLNARQDVLVAEESAVNSAISALLAKVNAYHAFNGRWSNAVTSL